MRKPAAQYLRMSTDKQRYSIESQATDPRVRCLAIGERR